MKQSKINKAEIRFVPLFAFQSAVPSIDSKRKKHFVTYLEENNPSLLENLIEFWKINRYKHFFLFKLKFLKKYSVDDLLSKLTKYQNNIKDNNPIFEIIKSNFNDKLNDIYLSIKIRSPKKHFKSEDYVPPFKKIEIDHRKPYYIKSIFHIDDSVLECRTCNFKKSKELVDFFSKILFQNQLQTEQIIIENSQLLKADQKSKCKEAILSGEWHGAQQILIRGEDVGRCIKELSSRNFNFQREGLTLSERKNESEQLLIVSDSETGKISIKKMNEDTADPYRYLVLKIKV